MITISNSGCGNVFVTAAALFVVMIGMSNAIFDCDLGLPNAPFTLLTGFIEVLLNREFSWPLDRSTRGLRVLFVTLRPLIFVVSGNDDSPPFLEKSTVFAPLNDFFITELSFSSPRLASILNGVEVGAIIV